MSSEITELLIIVSTSLTFKTKRTSALEKNTSAHSSQSLKQKGPGPRYSYHKK